jgi:hypothetical protein
VSCLAECIREPHAEAQDPLSWESLADTVRRYARTLPAGDAQDLLSFADLLEGFGELEKG